MKLVVDSNCLRDDTLAAFLRSARSNVAIVTDYAAMEALKGDAVVGMSESMRTLAGFPKQVQILKTTLVVCGLSGLSQGLQRRLVDVPLSKNFAAFCHDLRQASSGSSLMIGALRELGSEARTHMERIEFDAPAFAEASVKVARMFSAEERVKIVTQPLLATDLHQRLVLHVMHLSAEVFAKHPAVRRLPRSAELVNTYVFRSSLCHLLLGFKYAAVGGVPGKAPSKVRNDMVDSHFATYATYFDGILSKDRLTTDLHREMSLVLRRFRSTYFV